LGKKASGFSLGMEDGGQLLLWIIIIGLVLAIFIFTLLTGHIFG
jgi:hypothetical protein